MLRFSVACVLALFLACITIGCVRIPAPAPPPLARAAMPKEVDAPVKPIITPGRWHATGRDRAGFHWEGYLIVEHAPERYMRAGYFEWQTKPGGGRYHFDGAFDPKARDVTWIGYSVEERVGNAAMATYRATLSADGKRFENGTWAGGNSIPGTWTAEYVGE